MKFRLLIYFSLGIVFCTGCNSRQNATAELSKPKTIKHDTSMSVNLNSRRELTDANNDEYLTALFGAHSITKTVLGHYKLLNDDSDDEVQLFKRMQDLCRREKINSKNLENLEWTFAQISDLDNRRDRVITLGLLDSAKHITKEYVAWAFETFRCFEKGVDGRYYYQSE